MEIKTAQFQNLKWRRDDKVHLTMTIVFIIGDIFLLIFITGLFFDDPFFQLCFPSPVFMIFGIIYPLLFGWNYYVKRGMWNKFINLDCSSIISKIETALKYHGIPYRRLSSYNAIPKTFTIRYKEIFVLDDSDLKIKVQKGTQTRSIIDIGPVSDSNQYEIEKMKLMIDDTFNPGSIINNLTNQPTDYVPPEYRQ